MVRDRITLSIRQFKTRQELLKIRRVCIDVCMAAASAISPRTLLDDVYERVHVANHGRLLKRECRYCGRRHARKKCAPHTERSAIINIYYTYRVYLVVA